MLYMFKVFHTERFSHVFTCLSYLFMLRFFLLCFAVGLYFFARLPRDSTGGSYHEKTIMSKFRGGVLASAEEIPTLPILSLSI